MEPPNVSIPRNLKYLIRESMIKRASRLGSSRALTLDRIGAPKGDAQGALPCLDVPSVPTPCVPLPFSGGSRSLVWHGPLCYSCVRIEVVLLAARRVNALLPAKRPGSGPEQGQGGGRARARISWCRVWVSALSCQPNGKGGPAGGIGGGGGGGGGAAAKGSAPGPSVLPRT